MRNAVLNVAAAAVLMVLTAGCASTNRTMVGQARPAISPASVRVYESLPRRAEQVAIVQAKTVDGLRSEAAAVGANGVIVRGVVEKTGPVIGIGLGTSSYSFGRHSAVGVGTGASFAAPLGGNQVLEGDAVYVP